MRLRVLEMRTDGDQASVLIVDRVGYQLSDTNAEILTGQARRAGMAGALWFTESVELPEPRIGYPVPERPTAMEMRSEPDEPDEPRPVLDSFTSNLDPFELVGRIAAARQKIDPARGAPHFASDDDDAVRALTDAEAVINTLVRRPTVDPGSIVISGEAAPLVQAVLDAAQDMATAAPDTPEREHEGHAVVRASATLRDRFPHLDLDPGRRRG